MKVTKIKQEIDHEVTIANAQHVVDLYIYKLALFGHPDRDINK